MVELPIGNFGDRPVIRLEDDRDLVGVAVLEVAIEAVVRDVELPVLEPFVKRSAGFIEDACERLVPEQGLARELGPEACVIGRCGSVEPLEIRPLDVGLSDKITRRIEYARLARYGLDG